jgi:hypothetical protein
MSKRVVVIGGTGTFGARLVLAGRAEVTGATARGGRLLAWLFGLPTTAVDVPESRGWLVPQTS